MGCDYKSGDDFERCDNLIEDYKYLLEIEGTKTLSEKNLKKHNQEKEDIKMQIKELLEIINEKVFGIAQIDKLQKLNEKYQEILTEDSRIKIQNM